MQLPPGPERRGYRVVLVPVTAEHVPHLRRILRTAAIRCYAAVGFHPVGVLRRYERDVDGAGWHDGLLMDLLAEELAQPR